MVRSEQDNRADELDSYLTAAGETAAYRINVDGKDAGDAKLVRGRRPDLAGSQYRCETRLIPRRPSWGEERRLSTESQT